MQLSKKKKIIIVIGVLLAIFVALNFNYLLANARLFFRGQKSILLTGDTVNQVEQKMAANQLIIPSLGISAPLIYVSEKSEAVYQKALEGGAVHFPGTANPGEAGNAYFFGHSSDYFWSKGKYKTVFATLPSVKIGESIFISDAAGAKYEYKVIESKKVAANDTSVLAQDLTRQILTLQTSYPVGTALARWVVIAKLRK